MGSDSNGQPGCYSAAERLNVFALVIYVPDPLGGFLDGLRRELVPQCNPHAHVSVLPPRPVNGDWREAARHVQSLIEGWTPFEIELDDVETFPVTDVIYLRVTAGDAELRRLHAAMNTGPLEFGEPFAFHPHITLAQEVPHEDVPQLREAARRRWQDYMGRRSFRVEQAVFVQNTLDDQWIDLATYSMGAVTVP